MKPLFIVDIDGTVCDSAAAFRQASHIPVDDWGDAELGMFFREFAIHCGVVPGAGILPGLLASGKCDVVFLTGRSERIGRTRIGLTVTRAWLGKVFGMPKYVPLLMRPHRDDRPTHEVKHGVFRKEVLPSFRRRLFVFLDDDPDVLKLYSKHGIALKAPECWAALSHMATIQ